MFGVARNLAIRKLDADARRRVEQVLAHNALAFCRVPDLHAHLHLDQLVQVLLREHPEQTPHGLLRLCAEVLALGGELGLGGGVLLGSFFCAGCEVDAPEQGFRRRCNERRADAFGDLLRAEHRIREDELLRHQPSHVDIGLKSLQRSNA